MQAELDALDDKIHRLLQLCQKLRKDSTELRQRLVSAQQENKSLNEKVAAAAARLETLLAQVPEERE